MKTAKNLHLGSGGMYIDGYINTDFDDLPGVDLVLDASKVPYPFEDNTLDQIVNSHMLEHIEYKLAEPMIREWYRILKPGGEVVVDVPDFKEAIEMYQHGKHVEANLIIFGNNERPTQHHRWGWTYQTLAEVFKKAGFKKVEQRESTDYHVKLGIPTFRLGALK